MSIIKLNEVSDASIIRSIQKGRYQYSISNSGSGNISISFINKSKSILLLHDKKWDTNGLRYYNIELNESSITFSIIYSSTASIDFDWQVIEYK